MACDSTAHEGNNTQDDISLYHFCKLCTPLSCLTTSSAYPQGSNKEVMDLNHLQHKTLLDLRRRDWMNQIDEHTV